LGWIDARSIAARHWNSSARLCRNRGPNGVVPTVVAAQTNRAIVVACSPRAGLVSPLGSRAGNAATSKRMVFTTSRSVPEPTASLRPDGPTLCHASHWLDVWVSDHPFGPDHSPRFRAELNSSLRI
jgi:hypothetical protein